MVGLLLLNATVGFAQDLSAGNIVKVSRDPIGPRQAQSLTFTGIEERTRP